MHSAAAVLRENSEMFEQAEERLVLVCSDSGVGPQRLMEEPSKDIDCDEDLVGRRDQDALAYVMSKTEPRSRCADVRLVSNSHD
mmetsp:Transcript_21766/g.68187  ORF Transcript_21766/g.68187 Transcript_21766/m.68187 type:complete len:84 (+) Transcript_21766:108-359(+)